jgi:fatty acid desaturase
MIKNDFKNLFIYFFVTLGVFSIVTIAFNYNSFLGFILSIIIFGRLQIYYSEILHEATHFNFFRSFKLNSLISNIILYPFLLITVEKNRKSHFAHHKFKEGEKGFFTDEDPDTSMFSPNDFSLSNILKDLTGYTSIKFFFRKNIYNIKKSQRSILAFIFYNLYAFLFWFLIIVFTSHGIEILVCWGISALTIYSFLNRVRIYLNHKNFNGNYNISRDIKSDILSNLFISKMTLNHKMHHKYPSLPYRDLNKLAEEKMIPKDNCLSVIKMFI